jgi:hypothetical protein
LVVISLFFIQIFSRFYEQASTIKWRKVFQFTQLMDVIKYESEKIYIVVMVVMVVVVKVMNKSYLLHCSLYSWALERGEVEVLVAYRPQMSAHR